MLREGSGGFSVSLTQYFFAYWLPLVLKQHRTQLPAENFHRPVLHFRADDDVILAGAVVGVTGTGLYFVDGAPAFSQHGKVGIAEAVEVKAVHAHLPYLAAYAGDGRRLDVLAVGLGADEIYPLSRCRIGFFQRYYAIDRPALKILGRDDVVIEIVAAAGKLVGNLLFPPCRKQLPYALIKTQPPVRSRGFGVADVVEALMPFQRKPLNLELKGQQTVLDVAQLPRCGQSLPYA